MLLKLPTKGVEHMERKEYSAAVKLALWFAGFRKW